MFPVALHDFRIRYRAPKVFNTFEDKSIQLFGQSNLWPSCADQFTSNVHQSFTSAYSCLPIGLRWICVAKGKAELGLQSFSKTYISIYLTLYVTNHYFCTVLQHSVKIHETQRFKRRCAVTCHFEIMWIKIRMSLSFCFLIICHFWNSFDGSLNMGCFVFKVPCFFLLLWKIFCARLYNLYCYLGSGEARF